MLLALLTALFAIASAAVPAFSGPQVQRLKPSAVVCHTAPAATDTEASHNASARPPVYRPCTFSNLYLWNGTAHYIVAEGAGPPELSRLGLRFEVWSKREGDDAVLRVLRPVSAAQLSRMLAAASHGAGDEAPAQQRGGQGRERQQPEVPVREVIPRAYLWTARTVNPAVEGAACDPPGSGPAGKSNYGHFSAEWLPALYMTLCEYFGHCMYEDRQRLRLVDVQHRGCNRRENYPPYYAELLSCVSATPLQHIGGAALGGYGAQQQQQQEAQPRRGGVTGAGGHNGEQGLQPAVTLVEEAWVGLGPRCRGIVDGCYQGLAASGRLPPTPALLAGWRRLLGRCLGVDLERAVAPLQPPRVLLVDRLYTSGRSLLNANSLLRTLRGRYPDGAVTVRLEYMEGLSVRQQAALWSNATVVVHAHGAALGNYVFLPRHAVAVQLSALPRRDTPYNPAAYTKRLQGDLAGVSNISATDWFNSQPWRAHLNTEFVTSLFPRKPVLARFMADRAAYGAFVSTFRCPGSLAADLAAACKSLLLHLNFVVDPAAAANFTDAALRLAMRKQGHPLPAYLRDQGGGSAGSGGGGGDTGGAAAEQGQQQGQRQQEQQHGEQYVEQQGSGSIEGGGGGGAAQLRALRRVQAGGGVRLVMLGVAVGSASVLGLRAIGRLRRRPSKRPAAAL